MYDFVSAGREAEAKVKADGGRVFKFSTTERAVYKACRRKWYYSSLSHLGLEATITPRALHFGTGVHYALEQFYKAQIPGMGHAKDFDILAPWEEWTANERAVLAPVFLVNPDYGAQFEEDCALGREMLCGYKAFALERDMADFSSVLAVEAEFAMPVGVVGDTLLELVGRFDLVVEDTEGRVWIVDHKTAKSLINPSALVLNDQMDIYHCVGAHFFGVRAAGCLYNVLRKKAPQRPKLLKDGTLSRAKLDTTAEVYRATIEEHGSDVADYADVLVLLEQTAMPFFQRERVEHTRRQLEYARTALQQEAQDMAATEFFYPNKTNYCTTLCEFAPLCIATETGDDVDFLVDRLFRERAVEPGSVYERV